MAGSECWQKMTQTMEKRQPCLRNQGRRDGWCWSVAGLDVNVLSPHGILQVTLMPMQTRKLGLRESPTPRSPLDSEGSDGEVEESVAADEEVHGEDEEEEREVVGGIPRGVSLRMALVSLDEVDPRIVFRQRASVMRSVPKFLKGPFQNALKLALEEATWENSVQDEVRQERGWKLLELLPRMLLHQAPGGGLIAKKTLEARFQAFTRGEWVQLLRASSQCDEKAAVSRPSS